MAYLSEAAVEKLVLDQLRDLGYAMASDADIGPDGKVPSGNPTRMSCSAGGLLPRSTD
jgi:hypothetical protein